MSQLETSLLGQTGRQEAWATFLLEDHSQKWEEEAFETWTGSMADQTEVALWA